MVAVKNIPSNIGRAKLSMRQATLLVLLVGCLISSSSCILAQQGQKRPLLEFKFEKIEDFKEARSKYPFLSETFDLLKKDNVLMVEEGRQPASLLISEMSGKITGAIGNLVFVTLSGSMYCGSSGCETILYQLPAGKKLWSVHTSQPIYLARCGDKRISLIVPGSGANAGWVEWLYKNGVFEKLDSYPDLSSLPQCSSTVSSKTGMKGQ